MEMDVPTRPDRTQIYLNESWGSLTCKMAGAAFGVVDPSTASAQTDH